MELSNAKCGYFPVNHVVVPETYADRAAEFARVAAHPQAPMRKLKADENDIFNGELLPS